MPTTPNMGLILPTDHDTANDWGRLINNALTAVDAHTHAIGDGARVLISQLQIDADISFIDPGGGKHAITDLKAIDFFPVAASAMTGLAGAFFLSDGTGGLVANELYYRTTTGVNVRVTNGATLNVNAFTGGIGGDYGNVGALESFDDGLDAYVFQQQIGAAVRQYAKLYASDLHLFEFKAVGVTPPPGNNVTLKVPAGLANTFSLTLPGALPASKQILYVDNTGVISAVAEGTTQSTRTLQIPSTLFASVNGVALSYIGGQEVFVAGSAMIIESATVGLRAGDRITAIRFVCSDSATGPTKVQGSFGPWGGAAAGSTAVSAGTGAIQTLPILAGLPVTLATPGTWFWINLATTTGTNRSALRYVEIDYDHP